MSNDDGALLYIIDALTSRNRKNSLSLSIYSVLSKTHRLLSPILSLLRLTIQASDPKTVLREDCICTNLVTLFTSKYIEYYYHYLDITIGDVIRSLCYSDESQLSRVSVRRTMIDLLRVSEGEGEDPFAAEKDLEVDFQSISCQESFYQSDPYESPYVHLNSEKKTEKEDTERNGSQRNETCDSPFASSSIADAHTERSLTFVSVTPRNQIDGECPQSRDFKIVTEKSDNVVSPPKQCCERHERMCNATPPSGEADTASSNPPRFAQYVQKSVTPIRSDDIDTSYDAAHSIDMLPCGCSSPPKERSVVTASSPPPPSHLESHEKDHMMDASSNKAELLAIRKIVDAIFKSADAVPEPLRNLLRAIKEEADAVTAGRGDRVVAGFLILRIITPAIRKPDQFCDGPFSPDFENSKRNIVDADENQQPTRRDGVIFMI